MNAHSFRLSFLSFTPLVLWSQLDFRSRISLRPSMGTSGTSINHVYSWGRRRRGGNQMIILLHTPFSVKVSRIHFLQFCWFWGFSFFANRRKSDMATKGGGGCLRLPKNLTTCFIMDDPYLEIESTFCTCLVNFLMMFFQWTKVAWVIQLSTCMMG